MADSFHVRRDLLAIGLLLVGILSVGWRPVNTDAALRKRFSEHRDALDSLATMAMADTQLVGFGPSVMFVKDTPTYNRRLTDPEIRASGRSRFQPLLRRAGLPALSRQRDGDAIWFVVESHDGSRKGYMYSRTPKEPVLGSLDAAGGYGYVALAPRWFLFLQPAD